MTQKNHTLANILTLIILGFGLSWVFFGIDILPDVPGSIVGWLDDIAAMILFFVVAGKVRQYILGTKTQKGAGWIGLILYSPVIMIVLTYVFWALDFIPDTIPVWGFVDDSAVIIFGIAVIARLYRRYVLGKTK